MNKKEREEYRKKLQSMTNAELSEEIHRKTDLVDKHYEVYDSYEYLLYTAIGALVACGVLLICLTF